MGGAETCLEVWGTLSLGSGRLKLMSSVERRLVIDLVFARRYLPWFTSYTACILAPVDADLFKDVLDISINTEAAALNIAT
jgi:hypothetical protein